MSKKKTNSESKLQPVIESNVATTVGIAPGTGRLTKNPDENSEIDWVGKLALTAPGEYWLNGFMRKDSSGVYMELSAELKEVTDKNQINDDRGVLFKNNRKRLKHQPDYTGNITVTAAGEFSLDAVINVSKSNVTFMEISIVDSSVEAVEADEMPF